ncbi:MAG: hypothetical protein H6766_06305 [Candidatus Peribacteria bacterium]|nr:MAG: hypothetical protein H6766_06305 [Candidatus Peribacteria bacterium]
MDNMRAMGCDDHKDGYTYDIHTDGLQGADVRQRFPSVTGTENLILMAVMAEGTTTITNAACEPHTQDLCNMLVSMGAQIDGIGSNRLIITGVQKLSGTDWTIISDHIDIGGLVAAAAMTGGELTITHAITQHMTGILSAFEKLGVQTIVDRETDTIFVPGQQDLSIHQKENGTIFDLKALQWPLFPPDLVHTAVVLALKSQ